MFDNFFDNLFEAFIVLIFGAVAVIIVVIGLDWTYALRSERKQLACYEKRMDAKRVSFTTDVICVPGTIQTKNDTLTVNMNK